MALPSLPRLRTVTVRLLRRYYGMLRHPAPVSPRFVAFAWRYHALCLSLRSLRSMTRNRGPGVRQSGPHCRKMYAWRSTGPPRFPENPPVSMPCSPTPAGPRAPGQYGVSTWPTLCPRRRLPRQSSFGAQWHGLETRCLRFVAPVSPHTTQDSLPVACQTLPGGIRTRRILTKGFRK